MTAIPTENLKHIRSIVREELPESARPDFKPSNRWYRVYLSESEDQHSDKIVDACREAGYKVSQLPGEVKIVASPKHECGWKYRLHFGDLDGNTVLRYDNSHANSVGHERHSAHEDEVIEFPGMKELKQRFDREVNEWWCKQG